MRGEKSASSPVNPSPKEILLPEQSWSFWVSLFLSMEVQKIFSKIENVFLCSPSLRQTHFWPNLIPSTLTLPLCKPPFFHRPHNKSQCIFPKHGSNPNVSSWTDHKVQISLLKGPNISSQACPLLLPSQNWNSSPVN